MKDPDGDQMPLPLPDGDEGAAPSRRTRRRANRARDRQLWLFRPFRQAELPIDEPDEPAAD